MRLLKNFILREFVLCMVEYWEWIRRKIIINLEVEMFQNVKVYETVITKKH